MGNPSMGFSGVFLADSSGSLNSSSEAWEYIGAAGIVTDEQIVETDGIRGTRSRPDERTRAGTQAVGGQMSFNPGTTMLNAWYPRIFGGARSGSGPYTYPLAETLPSFSAGISRVAQDHFYATCYVNTATLKGSAGQLLSLDLDIQGKAETQITGGVFSGYGVAVPVDSPFMFFDAALTIGGTSYPIFDFELKIDNMLMLDRYMNSITRTSLPAGDRLVTLTTTNPFTSTEAALYFAGSGTAASFVITCTNGTHVTTFTLANVRYPAKSPTASGKAEEFKLPLVGTARSLGNGGSITRELVTTMTL